MIAKRALSHGLLKGSSWLFFSDQFVYGNTQRLGDIHHRMDGGVVCVAGFDFEESAVRDTRLSGKLILGQT
jgi:hypothetical protein